MKMSYYDFLFPFCFFNIVINIRSHVVNCPDLGNRKSCLSFDQAVYIT